MELQNIPSLIKQCPIYHLLQRTFELNEAIKLFAEKRQSIEEISRGIHAVMDFIFSGLNAWLRPDRAVEGNFHDYRCLLPYLHQRAIKYGGPKTAGDEKKYVNEILIILLTLQDQQRQPCLPNIFDYELINFLEGWADFLLGEAHYRRVTANG